MMLRWILFLYIFLLSSATSTGSLKPTSSQVVVKTDDAKGENSTAIIIPEWKKKLPFPLNNKTKTENSSHDEEAQISTERTTSISVGESFSSNNTKSNQSSPSDAQGDS